MFWKDITPCLITQPPVATYRIENMFCVLAVPRSIPSIRVGMNIIIFLRDVPSHHHQPFTTTPHHKHPGCDVWRCVTWHRRHGGQTRPESRKQDLRDTFHTNFLNLWLIFSLTRYWTPTLGPSSGDIRHDHHFQWLILLLPRCRSQTQCFGIGEE